MELKPKVSIVCRTFNHANIINCTIDSVLQQTFSDWELIISDDCSTDNTISKLQKYNDKRIIIHENSKNLGCVGNLNKVLSLATGEYICILDGDDVYHKDKIQKQVDFLDNNQDYGAVFTYVNVIDDNNAEITNHYVKELINTPSYSREEMLCKFFYYGNHLAFPTEMFRAKFKYIFPEYIVAMGDCNFHIHILLQTKIKVLEENLVSYRILKDSSNMANACTPLSNSVENLFVLDSFLKIQDLIFFKNIFHGKYEEFGNVTIENIPYLLSRMAMRSKINELWGKITFSKFISQSDNLVSFMEDRKINYKEFLKIKISSLRETSRRKKVGSLKRILLHLKNRFNVFICNDKRNILKK